MNVLLMVGGISYDTIQNVSLIFFFFLIFLLNHIFDGILQLVYLEDLFVGPS